MMLNILKKLRMKLKNTSRISNRNVDINEKKNICFIAIIIVLFTLFVAGAVTARFYKIRYNSTVSELGHIRTELAAATDRQLQLEATIGTVRILADECTEYVVRTEAVLDQSVTTVRELRAQIQDLEKYCNSLYSYIMCIRANVDNTDRSE